MRKMLFLSALAMGVAACDSVTEVAQPDAAIRAADATALSRSENDDEDDRRDEWQYRGTRRYRVTITNLTTGQPFSPGVVVTHSKRLSLFEKGERASAGIRTIAESGDPGVALAELPGSRGLYDLVGTGAPVGRIGGGPFPNTLSVEVDARGAENRLSLSVMLICTNDGFVGLDGVKLPANFRAREYNAYAYDAGSEVNSEVAGDIVPPCFAIGPVQGPVGGSGHADEHGRVRYHRGIQGVADLTAAHAWTGAVARVTVQRIQ